MSTIPEDIVTDSFMMDPETEDLIWGSDLKDGMVVLIEGSLLGRKKIMTGEPDLKTARWCEITGLHFTDTSWDSERNTLVRFIGVYADGTKASRTYNSSCCWYVKKDSIPEVTE